MKTKAAIEYFQTKDKRGRTDLARALTSNGWKVTPEAISQWGECPPMGRQFQIHLLSNGDLKVDLKVDKLDDQKVA